MTPLSFDNIITKIDDAKVMQKVKVETVLFYKRGDDGLPTTSEMRVEGIESLFKSVRFPKDGMTFLYGHRNPAIAYLLEYAGFSGLGAAIVDVHVDIGRWPRFKAHLGDDPDRGLRYAGVLSMPRVLKEVIDKVNEVAEETVGTPIVSKGIVTNPEALDHVMKDDTFKHLVLVTYMVETTEAGAFQVATVFDIDKIIEATTGVDLKDVELHL